MKLLVTGAFKYTDNHLREIKSLGYEVTFIQDERLPLEIDVNEIDAVVCNGLFLYNDIDKFKKLKFIQLTSAGLDRVPLDYIKEKGIEVFNAKGVYSAPMAEWVVLKILEIYKKSYQFYMNQSLKKWEKQRGLLELTEKTAAIIGFGSIGKAVAKRLKAFDMNIVAVDINKFDVLETEYIDESYKIKEVDKALIESDIVILTVPLTAETEYLINKEKFKLMKKDSVLINVSRGRVIEEKALIEALENKKIMGAGLDVFEEEPLQKESELWNLENIIITPHNSFVSDRTSDRFFEILLKNLKENLMKNN